MKPALVLLTTTDGAGGRRDHLDRMVATVVRFAETQPEASVRLTLLVQRAPAGFAVNAPPGLVDCVVTPERLSLSAARNRMLALRRADGALHEGSILLFPDDDCWYPDGVLKAISAAFSDDEALDLWFSRYSSEPEPIMHCDVHPASAADVVRRASSNTMVFRGSLVAPDLNFDEGLGVGTPINGGEDTAFVLRAFGRAKKALFVDKALIGHRDPDPSFAMKYYHGALIAIAQNVKVPGVGHEFARKLAIGLVLALRGHISVGQFVRDAGTAIAIARRALPPPRSR